MNRSEALDLGSALMERYLWIHLVPLQIRYYQAFWGLEERVDAAHMGIPARSYRVAIKTRRENISHHCQEIPTPRRPPV